MELAYSRSDKIRSSDVIYNADTSVSIVAKFFEGSPVSFSKTPLSWNIVCSEQFGTDSPSSKDVIESGVKEGKKEKRKKDDQDIEDHTKRIALLPFQQHALPPVSDLCVLPSINQARSQNYYSGELLTALIFVGALRRLTSIDKAASPPDTDHTSEQIDAESASSEAARELCQAQCNEQVDCLATIPAYTEISDRAKSAHHSVFPESASSSRSASTAPTSELLYRLNEKQNNKYSKQRALYKLVAGDTLNRIAERFYHDARIAWLILKLNKGRLKCTVLEDMTAVETYAGQVIELPTWMEVAEFSHKKAWGRRTPSELITIVKQENALGQDLERELVEGLGVASPNAPEFNRGDNSNADTSLKSAHSCSNPDEEMRRTPPGIRLKGLEWPKVADKWLPCLEIS